jgi:hypothetical protein
VVPLGSRYGSSSLLRQGLKGSRNYNHMWTYGYAYYPPLDGIVLERISRTCYLNYKDTRNVSQ